MDRACEDGEAHQLVWQLRITPVIPLKYSRMHPWSYDRKTYQLRNQVGRLFYRLRSFCRVVMLNIVYQTFLMFACMIDALKFNMRTFWLVFPNGIV